MAELFFIDKPYGWSSFRAVEWLKRHFGLSKAGHAGTLDPLATGLLLIATGAATRQIHSLQSLDKEYYALLILGYTTASDDAEFPPEYVAYPRFLTKSERQAILNQFVGCIKQRPPSYSALKIRGRRAYQLARRGEVIQLPPRPVEIYDIQEVAYDPPHRWLLRITCGKGVYIRSLARDIGEVIGSGAYLGALRRTRIGPYTVQQALQPDGYLF
ncbi:MAG: tRNA pseudouridine(55) synthase TruB [Bacteroidia bacterium]